jgi:hypothetical protein
MSQHKDCKYRVVNMVKLMFQKMEAKKHTENKVWATILVPSLIVKFSDVSKYLKIDFGDFGGF